MINATYDRSQTSGAISQETRTIKHAGWHFILELKRSTSSDAGGFIVRNVYHDMYSLARSIRLVGLIVRTNDGKELKLTLNTLDFEIVSSEVQLAQANDTIDGVLSENFSDHPVKIHAQVVWRYLGPVIDSEPDAVFEVTQSYAFTEYGMDPPHEPSGYMLVGVGGLRAARVHPVTKFKYTGGTAVVEVIADYRMELGLDSTIDREVNPGVRSKYPNWTFPNQYGLFKDADSPSGIATGPPMEIFKQIQEKYEHHANGAPDPDDFHFVQATIESMEKPSLYESEVWGYKDGNTILLCELKDKEYRVTDLDPEVASNAQRKDITATRGWDNLHMWGSRGQGNYIISVIGAAHCFHYHWRWGVMALVSSAMGKLLGLDSYENFEETMDALAASASLYARETITNENLEKITGRDDLVDLPVTAPIFALLMKRYAKEFIEDPDLLELLSFGPDQFRGVESMNPVDFAKSFGDWALQLPRDLPTAYDGFSDTGVLIDDALRQQSLQLSILRYDARTDPDKQTAASILNTDFSTYRFRNRSPQAVNTTDANKFEGAQLVLWTRYSAKIDEDDYENRYNIFKPYEVSCSFFVPGFYFGHNQEPSELSFRDDAVKYILNNVLTGDRLPHYVPWGDQKIKTINKWMRAPDLYH